MCRGFESVAAVHQHVIKEHFETNVAPVQLCLWLGCDNVPRQRWSLMTHLQVALCTSQLLCVFYSAPLGELGVMMSVCLSVCPRRYFWNCIFSPYQIFIFLCKLPTSVVWSFSGGIAVRYVLLVLWIMLHLMLFFPSVL